jgi:hypothetical protein
VKEICLLNLEHGAKWDTQCSVSLPNRHEYVMSVVPKLLALKDANIILNSELESHISEENIKYGHFYMVYDSKRVTS